MTIRQESKKGMSKVGYLHIDLLKRLRIFSAFRAFVLKFHVQKPLSRILIKVLTLAKIGLSHGTT